MTQTARALARSGRFSFPGSRGYARGGGLAFLPFDEFAQGAGAHHPALADLEGGELTFCHEAVDRISVQADDGDGLIHAVRQAFEGHLFSSVCCVMAKGHHMAQGHHMALGHHCQVGLRHEYPNAPIPLPR